MGDSHGIKIADKQHLFQMTPGPKVKQKLKTGRVMYGDAVQTHGYTDCLFLS